MAAPIHLFNRAAHRAVLCYSLALLVGPLAVFAHADERGGASVLTDDDMAIIERSEEISEKASDRLNIDDFFPPDMGEDRRDAEKFFADLARTNPTLQEHVQPDDGPREPGERYAGHHTLLFASFSLERQGLEDMFELASEDPGVAIIFRGIPDDMEVAEGVLFLQTLAAEYTPIPSVVIDPTLFRDHVVNEVPTLIRIGDSPHPDDVIARVAGISEPQWLDRQLEHGERGDFGIRGPVVEIEERDMIEVMQERVAQINWEQKREDAAERFWSRQTFQWMPPATRPRTRKLDPRVRVYDDIVGAEGQVIAAAGSVINPLDSVPFDQAIIVFNATDKREMELVAERLPALTANVSRVMLIATELDADEGWDAYKEVTDFFDAPLYLLTPDVKSRFELEFTPSVITSDGENFVIQELVRGRDDA